MTSKRRVQEVKHGSSANGAPLLRLYFANKITTSDGGLRCHQQLLPDNRNLVVPPTSDSVGSSYYETSVTGSSNGVQYIRTGAWAVRACTECGDADGRCKHLCHGMDAATDATIAPWVFTAIERSDAVIVESLTTERYGVMAELAYAHGRGKFVVLDCLRTEPWHVELWLFYQMACRSWESADAQWPEQRRRQLLVDILGWRSATHYKELLYSINAKGNVWSDQATHMAPAEVALARMERNGAVVSHFHGRVAVPIRQSQWAPAEFDTLCACCGHWCSEGADCSNRFHCVELTWTQDARWLLVYTSDDPQTACSKWATTQEATAAAAPPPRINTSNAGTVVPLVATTSSDTTPYDPDIGEYDYSREYHFRYDELPDCYDFSDDDDGHGRAVCSDDSVYICDTCVEEQRAQVHNEIRLLDGVARITTWHREND